MNRVRVILKSVPRPSGSGRDRMSSVGPLPNGRGTVGDAGFTLIELLVVVAVLLILMAMTITAIDFTFTSERVRSGARQVQSALEGARDRAIFAKEERGLRLLVDVGEDRNGNGVLDSEDSNGNWTLDSGEDTNGNGVLDYEDSNRNGVLDLGNPRIVTSMIYVRKLSGNWNHGQIRLERADFDGNPGADPPYNINIVRGSADCGWYTLKQRGYLGVFEPDTNGNGILEPSEDFNGNGVRDLDTPRIKIPADENGQWHVVLTHRLTAANQILELIPAYKGTGTSQQDQVVAFLGTGPSTYELELQPRISPDAQPILLPEGVCIDLDGSDVPSSWRPPPTAQVTGPYSPHMDILFSSRGVVSGPPEVAAKGLIHLYLAERKDVIHAVEIGVEFSGGPAPVPRQPVNNSLGATALVPDVKQFNPEESIGQRKVITIFTQTGKVSTHEVDPTPKSISDGYAKDPFGYATRGEAQSQ